MVRIPSFIPFFGKRSALQRLAAITPIILARGAEAEARAIVDELGAAPGDKRLQRAIDGGLPQSAVKLGPHAGAVLAVLIDDDVLRHVLGEAAFLAWLDHDRPACIAYTIARAHRLSAQGLWQLLLQIEDASEVYEVFAPVFRRSSVDDARALLVLPLLFDADTVRRVFGDARIVDLALEMIAKDVRASCTLLGLNGSPRAVDELRAVLERVPADDERDSAYEDSAIAAIDGLDAALVGEPFIDVLAKFLVAQPKRLVPHMYLSMRITQYAIALEQHPLVRAHPDLQRRIEQAAMPPPMPVG